MPQPLMPQIKLIDLYTKALVAYAWCQTIKLSAVLTPIHIQSPPPSSISHSYLVKRTFSPLSQILLILSKLAFNPSTYHTSSKTGNRGMSTVPMPLITNLFPSPKVTVPIFTSKRVLNKLCFLSYAWDNHYPNTKDKNHVPLRWLSSIT